MSGYTSSMGAELSPSPVPDSRDEPTPPQRPVLLWFFGVLAVMVAMGVVLVYPTSIALPCALTGSDYSPALVHAQCELSDTLRMCTFFLALCVGLIVVMAVILERRTTMTVAWLVLAMALGLLALALVC
ncbi:hypothetical protein [Ruficoccus sp. ZRK36]|uniref:hypothetical protein n=1 Tax=Ruficoccus sp. ZRK36 TaxID=2866311 RepID=UPI001C72A5E2|nr:hypothetical protein [Ruficoccus sp. ZRK36]QYY36251.1 hypothetical protein K0V07_02010 [Ruficoccus sp. ZRK36]